MRPTAQHQHASSRAIAALATLDSLPAASIARRLSTSRFTPALAWIGYTYLDDSRRIMPAFLNPTGVMCPSVE